MRQASRGFKERARAREKIERGMRRGIWRGRVRKKNRRGERYSAIEGRGDGVRGWDEIWTESKIWIYNNK